MDANITDWITAIAAIITAAGIWFVRRQVNLAGEQIKLLKDQIEVNRQQMEAAEKQKRAEFIANLFFDYLKDPATEDMFFLIENKDFHLRDLDDKELNINNSLTRKLDKLLAHFEKVSSLFELGSVTIKDIEIIKHEFLLVYDYPDVQQYLQEVEDYGKQGHFPRFQKVAKELKSNNGKSLGVQEDKLLK